MAEDKEKGSGVKPEPIKIESPVSPKSPTSPNTTASPKRTSSPITTPPTATPPFLAWPPLLLHPWAPALLPSAWCSSAALRTAFPGLVT